MPNGSGRESTSTITSKSTGTYYSVPHPLVRREVDVRLTATVRRSLSRRQARRLASSFTAARKRTRPRRTTCRKRIARIWNGRPALSQLGSRDRSHTRDLVDTYSSTVRTRRWAIAVAWGCSRLAKRYGDAASRSRLPARASRSARLRAIRCVSILRRGLDRNPCRSRDGGERTRRSRTTTCAAPITTYHSNLHRRRRL